jgi:hypothetical protein
VRERRASDSGAEEQPFERVAERATVAG